MLNTDPWYLERCDWLADMLSATTDEYSECLPSEWSETARYLPKATTPQPGPFSFDATPYWREVVDNFDPNSPVQFTAVQKGAQVAFTVGVLENLIGYAAAYLRTIPVLFFTADKDLAELKTETNVVPMFQHSDLGHIIQSNDTMRKNKQGLTNKKIEWAGGGYMLPLGANNANKMRSLSAPWLLRDEISGWPLIVGRDADPLQLTETRTNSYELTRKVLDGSTPNITATDAISKRFALGDQRYYNIPCKHCGEFLVLKFRGTTEDGVVFGLIWRTTPEGNVEPGSVRYVCPHCSGEMTNDDKLSMMQHGKWVPTAVPSRPNFRSYHLSAMYAPYFARTWEAIAHAWTQAWDDEANVPRDLELLQVFYNNDLGEPFEQKADKIKLHQVSPHRRREYRMGELPLQHSHDNAGGPIQVVTMAVDVQGSFLSVAIFGWAPSADNSGYNSYLIDYFHIEGECESSDATPWVKLGEIIDTREYLVGGRRYRIAMTLVDASYLPDTVYDFCEPWEDGVYPLRGRDKPLKNARIKEFDVLESSRGARYMAVTVDLYKDRWSAALKRQWSGVDRMPRGMWSAPVDLPDKAINELTVEFKREKKDPQTGKLLGTYWHRPGNARQELWDLLVYNTAAIEMIAYDVCEQVCGIEALVWPEFWAQAAEPGLYWDVDDTH